MPQPSYSATTTIAAIHHSPGWMWAYCVRMVEGALCNHSAPIAIAPWRIRFGGEASSDLIRQNLRCSKCGGKGGLIYHPSWGGDKVGYEYLPDEWLADSTQARARPT